MFKRLQQKWGVSGGRLFLILCTFALGGSLCGWTGRKILSLTGLERGAVWVGVYILLITILWPLAVLLVSVPLGQTRFFLGYLRRVGRKLAGRKKEEPKPPLSSRNAPAAEQRHTTP